MKKIIALSLILISFTTHAKIYELNTQTFVENNIIKHIPDYSSYPTEIPSDKSLQSNGYTIHQVYTNKD